MRGKGTFYFRPLLPLLVQGYETGRHNCLTAKFISLACGTRQGKIQRVPQNQPSWVPRGVNQGAACPINIQATKDRSCCSSKSLACIYLCTGNNILTPTTVGYYEEKRSSHINKRCSRPSPANIDTHRHAQCTYQHEYHHEHVKNAWTIILTARLYNLSPSESINWDLLLHRDLHSDE